MRHRVDGRQFGRNTPHRRAMFRNLAANLLTHERIVTTDAKAKELRRVAERLITKAWERVSASFDLYRTAPTYARLWRAALEERAHRQRSGAGAAEGPT